MLIAEWRTCLSVTPSHATTSAEFAPSQAGTADVLTGFIPVNSLMLIAEWRTCLSVTPSHAATSAEFAPSQAGTADVLTGFIPVNSLMLIAEWRTYWSISECFSPNGAPACQSRHLTPQHPPNSRHPKLEQRTY